MNFLSLQNILLMTPILFLALPVHEFAHGWVAYKLGDPTAKMAGRLTLNPFKHLDVIGVLMMYTVGFGWAKPVPVNFSNLKTVVRERSLWQWQALCQIFYSRS